MAGKPLRSHAAIHQINIQWRRGDWRGPVALQRFWALSFSFPDPCWTLSHRRSMRPQKLAARKRTQAGPTEVNAYEK